jgi:hypothetical protein
MMFVTGEFRNYYVKVFAACFRETFSNRVEKLMEGCKRQRSQAAPELRFQHCAYQMHHFSARMSRMDRNMK